MHHSVRRSWSLLALGLFLAACGAPTATQPAAPAASAPTAAPEAQPAAAAAIAPAAPAAPLTDITVVLPNPSAVNFFPIYTAIGEGYFAAEGLRVQVEAVDGSSQVLQAMAAGQAQIGAPGPGPLLRARARGEDVVFFYNQNPKSVFGILVREESAYQSPAELKGKVIGVGTADGAEVSFTRTILNDLGLVEGTDYTFLPVGDGGLAAAAFERGDVDAYAAAVVDGAIMRARGLKLREITPPEYLNYFANGYATMAPYLAQNPQVIEGYGRAIAKATAFGLQNKARVLEHCAAANPQEGEDVPLASALFDAISVRMTPAVEDKRWGYQPPEHWQTWMASLVKTGDLDAPLPDITAAYTNKFVDTYNKGVGQ